MKSIFKKIIVFKLTWLARIAICRFRPKIIAVTGNVGKTSTKDAIYSVVKTAYKARKSEKSLNSDIGLPLAILGLESAWGSPMGWLANLWKGVVVALGRASTAGGSGAGFPELLVLEVGADHPGDIAAIGRWLHPDIVVLTRMSDTPVHVEFFPNVAAVFAEKMELVHAMKSGKDGGTLIVNADDEQFMGAVKQLDTVKDATIAKIFYGKASSIAEKNPDVQIIKSEVLYDKSPLILPMGQYANIRVGKKEEKIELKGIIGAHLVYPVAAACAVAMVLGIESKIEEAFSDTDPSTGSSSDLPKGRMRLLPGREKSIIIDDTYNSSPIACTEALKTLGSLSIKGRKIAVLADMKELGEYTEKAHREVGVLAGETLHTLVTVGEAARFIAVGAKRAGLSADRIFSYDNSRLAADAVAGMIRPGDVILVKGSQSMRMERVSAALLADTVDASEVLVRQEKVWEGK